MKVTLLTSRSCAVIGNHGIGAVIEVDDAEGGRMIAAGQAEAATPPTARTPAARAARKRAPRSETR